MDEEKKYREPTPNETFTRKGCKVAIRSEGERVEIVIDDVAHEVRFLDNGRPYTRSFVNVMAKSVRDLAERFVDFSVAQEAHWAEVDARRAKDADQDQPQDCDEKR